MANRISKAKAIVIGGSAGGYEVLRELFSNLPGYFSIPVIGVIHRSSQFESNMEKLLQETTGLKIMEAYDKAMLLPGLVYLAPAGYHLLIEADQYLSLDLSEPVYFCRPSIDVLFESAADVYGDKLIAILLSGANADGAAGLKYAKTKGAVCLLQNPKDAEFNAMPLAAFNLGAYDELFTKKDAHPMISEIHKLIDHVNT